MTKPQNPAVDPIYAQDFQTLSNYFNTADPSLFATEEALRAAIYCIVKLHQAFEILATALQEANDGNG